MAKSITLNFLNYKVSGVADVTMWGGGNGCIEMTPFTVNSLDTGSLIKGLNDAGFGVQSINGGVCDISENYDGYLVFKNTVVVGKVSELSLDYHSEVC